MIAPGTILQNRYLVEEQIGQGGMGAVFVATDQRFGSRVALKETFFTDPNLRKAFEREARLLNRLRHHALPRVSDHFTEDEGQFLVMEYIPGDDLAEMLKKRGAAFAPDDVLAWADQLLDALDYLHTQEPAVIHRDIKPQNLKLTARNQIVLLDFGLAKGTPLQTRVTATGSVLGYSLNYAPLEQMQGAGTDPRSDLYSLGATLHHLFTGATPPDALTRATAVLNGDEDPLRPASELHARVPPAVAAVLTRAMSQSAARRFATAAEMRDALREAARDVPAASHATHATSATSAKAATPVSEQETRLLNEHGTARVVGGAIAKEANVDSSQPDAPTLTHAARTASAEPPTAHAASQDSTKAAGIDSVSTKVRDAGSVVTSVRGPRPAAASGGRRMRRMIGVVSLVLGVVFFAVYAFKGRDEQPPANVEQPAAQTATPSVNAAPAPTVESQTQTVEAPAPTPAPAQPASTQPAPRRAGVAATTTRDAAPASANRAGRGVNVVVAPEVPEVPEFDEEDMRKLREAQGLANRNMGLTQEQLQAIMRQATEARRRAVQQRRTNERERRRQRRAPLPPPPQP